MSGSFELPMAMDHNHCVLCTRPDLGSLQLYVGVEDQGEGRNHWGQGGRCQERRHPPTPEKPADLARREDLISKF